jgi:hypothetical protein
MRRILIIGIVPAVTVEGTLGGNVEFRFVEFLEQNDA